MTHPSTESTVNLDRARVFVLSEHIHPADNSTGYFWSKLIGRLACELGEVQVLGPQDPSVDPLPPGVRYHAFAAPVYDKNRILSRLLGQIRLSWRLFTALRQQVSKGDVVLCGTNPVMFLMWMPLVRRWLGFRWALLIHDVYPDNLVPAGLMNSRAWAYRLLSRYFDGVYRRAELIIVIGRDMQRTVAQKVGPGGRVVYIPNWVDEQDLDPTPRAASTILNSLGWQDRIVFQFFGNLGRLQGIDHLLQAIQQVTHPGAAFLFIGSGVMARKVKQFAEAHDRGNVVYWGPLPQSRKSHGLAACDVALITLAQGMAGCGVPSKAYFSMAAGKPLLAVMAVDSEIALTVAEHQIGWVCEPANPAALAQLIDQICEGVGCPAAGNPRQVFEQHYAERVGLERFMREFRSVL